MCVLLVEDDATIRTAVEIALQQEGLDVIAVADGQHLEADLDAHRPDLAILDVRLPAGPDGFELARQLRVAGDLPILLLTAAGDVESRLRGFEVGADDYVVKPFSMSELAARVHALLRRSGRASKRIWRRGDIVVDHDARTASRAGHVLSLTHTEFELLVSLTNNAGRVRSKTQLLGDVWGFAQYDANLVEVHISALRKKIEEHGDRLIHTVRGAGYVFRQ
jgi:DNA-binding response OmpR family regulator